jgi:hypothetical protein
MATYAHMGVPVNEKPANADYIEGGKVWATNPDDHPYQVEYLCFDADSPMHEDIRTKNHVAFWVDDVDAAIAGQKVISEPFNATDTLRVAFINDNGAIIEVMQNI